MKARFWNFNKNDHRMVSGSSVLLSYRVTTAVGNANGKFILTPTICVYLASERDTIRGVQIRAGAIYTCIYSSLQIKFPYLKH